MNREELKSCKLIYMSALFLFTILMTRPIKTIPWSGTSKTARSVKRLKLLQRSALFLWSWLRKRPIRTIPWSGASKNRKEYMLMKFGGTQVSSAQLSVISLCLDV